MNILQKSYSRAASKAKKLLLFSALVIALTALVIISLICGSAELNTENAFNALLTKNYGDADFRILFYLRVPRILAALLSGSALAVSGVLIQAVLNNPMAAPNVIGVNSGAGLAAALTIAIFPNAISILPLTSFIGALSACLLIFLISVKTSASKLTIALVGIAVGSLLNSLINAIKVFFPDSVYDADLFMIGGFSQVTYEKIFPASIVIFIGLFIAYIFAGQIDILSLGDTSAKALGLNIKFLSFAMLITASALAGASVSFSGLLGFVGLLVPHIMRHFTGERHKLLIPASALAGGAFVLLCDLISRVAFAPFEIPVGIILSLAGGIFFIFLVLLSKKGI